MAEKTRLDEAVEGFIEEIRRRLDNFGSQVYDDLKLLGPMLGMLAMRGTEETAGRMLEKVARDVEDFKQEIRELSYDVKRENWVRDKILGMILRQ